MNSRAILIGGLVATILPFILAMVSLRTLITFYVTMFIGAAIAGVMSINKSNSWKNGACAVALMEILFLFMMYLMHEPFEIIAATPSILLTGAIGGFIGGRMKS